jgi:hypothetical protein
MKVSARRIRSIAVMQMMRCNQELDYKLRNTMIWMLLTGLFVFENQDFFEFSEKYQKLGYSWAYTGLRECQAEEPCLPLVDPETGRRVTYFMLMK